MKVRFEADLCVGHGRCYALAPEVYDTDDHGHCVLRHEEVPAALADQARVGAANCPEGALIIDETIDG